MVKIRKQWCKRSLLHLIWNGSSQVLGSSIGILHSNSDTRKNRKFMLIKVPMYLIYVSEKGGYWSREVILGENVK